LGVLFAATITVAPFVYFGKIRSFLFATALTLAAVIGQGLTAFLVSIAIGNAASEKGAPSLVTFLLIVVVAYGFAGSLVYVWKGIPKSIHATSRRERAPDTQEARASSWPPWLWG
jgi:Na+/phosphate symporter